MFKKKMHIYEYIMFLCSVCFIPPLFISIMSIVSVTKCLFFCNETASILTLLLLCFFFARLTKKTLFIYLNKKKEDVSFFSYVCVDFVFRSCLAVKMQHPQWSKLIKIVLHWYVILILNVSFHLSIYLF